MKEEIEFVVEACPKCGCLFAIPERFRQSLLRDHKTFYCPNGHGQSYK